VKCCVEDAKFPTLLKDASGLVIRTYTRVDAGLLERAPKLKVVGRAGVGLERVDLKACHQRNIAVVHTPDANTQAVAEYVYALLFDAMRPRLFLDKAIDEKSWRQLRNDLRARRQLSDCTLGVLGMGKVGQRVARAAQGFGVRTIYTDLVEIDPSRRFGAEPVLREELFARADIISLHVDSRPGNRHLVDAALLGRMKSDAILVNTSRGFVIEPYACADFFIKNPAASALLDVHDPEPFDAAYPLIDIPNVHLAPHIAAATEAANRAMSWVVRDVARVLEGQRPEHAACPFSAAYA
jgi:phosphoglycerate dehydrogenase-like enzyme